MNISALLDYAGPVIYTALAIAALYGIFCVVLLVLRIGQKTFKNDREAERFLGELREYMVKADWDGAVALCDSPQYWSKAVPQLVLIALTNADRPMPSLRRLLGEKFERDVLSDLEFRHSWIGTIVKSAPMLGLLGTVTGMIGAFATLASNTGGSDPKGLAEDISFALFTTALGLTVAIPLTLLGAWVRVRMSRMEDSVQQYLGEFLEDFDAARKGELKPEQTA